MDKTPPPSGRVTLHTSFGKVQMELWAREAPRGCRNFLQHCVDQYYDGCIFHRVVKGFLVQTGDPTATGDGGASCYEGGKAFPTETHPNVRFKHRGIVAMAGEDGDNRSQFFITLQEAPHLDGKHTILGRVVPETIYPVLSVEATPCKGERPIEPPRILSVTIDDNPFEDMVARPRAAAAAAPAAAPKKAVKKRKGVNDKALLSMADEWDALEEGFDASEGVLSTFVKGSRVASAHDVIDSDQLHQASVHTEARKREIRKMNEEFERKHGRAGGGADVKTEKLKRRIERQQARKKRKRGDDDDGARSDDGSLSSDDFVARGGGREETDERKAAKAAELAAIKEAQQKMKEEINRFKKKAGEDVSVPEHTGPKTKGLQWLEEQRAKFGRQRGQRGGNREKEAVLKLTALRQTLKKEQVKPSKTPPAAPEAPAAPPAAAPAAPTRTAAALVPGEADVSSAYETPDAPADAAQPWFKDTLTFANPQADVGDDKTMDDGYMVVDEAAVMIQSEVGKAAALSRDQARKMVLERKKRMQAEARGRQQQQD